MTFGDYVRLLRTYWRSILSVIVVAVLAAFGLTFLMTPVYTASSQVLFTPAGPGSTVGQDLAFAAQYTQSRMVTYQDLVTTPQILGPVVSGLDIDVTPTKLAEDVSAEFDPSSTLLTINVENESASRAARIVRAVSSSLINAVGDIETRANPDADEEGADPDVQVVTGRLVSDPPDPTDPTSPDLKLFLTAGALLGVLLGLGQAAVRFLRRRYAGEGPADQVAAEPEPEPEPPAPAPQPQQQPQQPANQQRTTKPNQQKRPGKRTRR